MIGRKGWAHARIGARPPCWQPTVTPFVTSREQVVSYNFLQMHYKPQAWELRKSGLAARRPHPHRNKNDSYKRFISKRQSQFLSKI
jgi:hypothetical protein